MSADEQIEWKLKQLKVPEVDVQAKVMGQIVRANSPQSIMHKRMVLTVTILIFLVGTGFASFTFMNLYHDNGSIAFTVENDNDANSRPILTEEMSAKFLSLIEPGEAIAIYNPEGNPDHIITSREKPMEITHYPSFRERVGNSFVLPEHIAGYHFVHGVIHHVLEPPDIDRLINDSQKQNGEIVFEKIRVTPEIYGLTMTLLGNGDEYLVSLFQGERWNTVYTDFKKIEKSKVIKVLGSEGFLSFEEGKAIFLWRKKIGGQDIFYRITTNEASKDMETTLVMLIEHLAKPTR